MNKLSKPAQKSPGDVNKQSILAYFVDGKKLFRVIRITTAYEKALNYALYRERREALLPLQVLERGVFH